MRSRLRNAAAAAGVALMLAGCGTPGPVRDLANRTAANTTQVSSQLRALNAASQNLAEARATNVARLKDTVREVRGRHSLDIALIQQTGDARSLALKKDIADWILEARAAAHNMTVQEFRAQQDEAPVDAFAVDVEAILNDLESLDPKTNELNEVGKFLAELSKEEDLQARARFLVGYVREVRKEVEAKQAAAEAAAAAAKSTAREAGKATGETAGN